MAKGFKTGGRDFVRGVSGNPRGPVPMPPEFRALRQFSPDYVKRVISNLALMTRDEMQTFLSEGDPNTAELAVASIISKAIAEGDAGRLTVLLDRSVGRVVEQKTAQLQPVHYVTSVAPSGALIQSVIDEALGEEDGDGGK